MDATSRIMDVDDPSTWPEELTQYMRWLDDQSSKAEFTSDIETNERAEEAVRWSLRDTYILAFHATRLMDHEDELIRRHGLRVFSEQLFEDRIAAAWEAGVIDAEVRDLLRESHMYATGEMASGTRGTRAGLLCLTIGRSVFRSIGGVADLMSHWGGEGLYFSRRGVEISELLRSLGQPTLVKVAIPVHQDPLVQRFWPGLDKVLVGSMRGLEDAGGDVLQRSAVPAADVIDVLQPGHPEFDALDLVSRLA